MLNFLKLLYEKQIISFVMCNLFVFYFIIKFKYTSCFKVWTVQIIIRPSYVFIMDEFPQEEHSEPQVYLQFNLIYVDEETHQKKEISAEMCFLPRVALRGNNFFF